MGCHHLKIAFPFSRQMEVRCFLPGFGLDFHDTRLIRICDGHGLSHPSILWALGRVGLQAILDVSVLGLKLLIVLVVVMGRIIFASQNVVPVSATVGGRVLMLAGEFATPFRRVGQLTRITLSTALANVTMTAGGKTSCCQYLDVCLEILPPPFGAKNHVGRNPLLQPPQPKISNFNATNSLSSGAERVGSFADLSMSLVPSLGQLSADRAHSWIKRAGAEPLTRQAVLCRFTPDVLLASSSQQLPREMDRTWLSIHVLNLIFRTLLVNASCPPSAEFPSALP